MASGLTPNKAKVILWLKSMKCLNISLKKMQKNSALHDHEGFGDVEINEHTSVGIVADYAAFITTHGKVGVALLAEYGLAEATTMLKSCYHTRG